MLITAEVCNLFDSSKIKHQTIKASFTTNSEKHTLTNSSRTFHKDNFKALLEEELRLVELWNADRLHYRMLLHWVNNTVVEFVHSKLLCIMNSRSQPTTNSWDILLDESCLGMLITRFLACLTWAPQDLRGFIIVLCT